MSNDYSKDFGSFEGKIWLNCSHQGPLPLVAVTEAEEALSWKIAPHKLTQERFDETPLRLKRALGKLINAPAEDIILGNSASYGLHLLANGFPWKPGDEVLLARDDFPSDILPWLGLQERGVKVKFIETRSFVLQPEELLENLTASTRLLCVTWVHSFTAGAIDVQSIGEICRAHDITFMLNCSQALGTRPLDVSLLPVDGITCVGFKWLCGPYGTGFCWMKPDLRESLRYNQAYWLAMQTAADLKTEPKLEIKTGLGARKYDVFGTANFLNFKPWTASVEYLLDCGIENIKTHNRKLVSLLVEGLDAKKFCLLSPPLGEFSSTIVIITHVDPNLNQEIFDYLKQNDIEIALRIGNLRVSPHLYNRESDINELLTKLNSY